MIFIIHSKTLADYALECAADLETRGYSTYVPMRDTDQKDTPENIVRANAKGISEAEGVYLIWDGKSDGAMVDLGFALAFKKPVYIVRVDNPNTRWGRWLKSLEGKTLCL